MADVGRITELWRAAADALELHPDPQRMAKLDALVRAERVEAEVARLRAECERWKDRAFDALASLKQANDNATDAEAECDRLREQLDAASFSARDLALILIAVGGDMTPEADQFVSQETWDALFNEGLAETRRPLHGDAYSALTATGREALTVAARAALGVVGEQE